MQQDRILQGEITPSSYPFSPTMFVASSATLHKKENTKYENRRQRQVLQL